MKILFLPILQIPVGHHTVADSMIRSIQKKETAGYLQKVDLFSYTSPALEKFLRMAYLGWIRKAPGSYGKIYLKTMHTSSRKKTYGVLKVLAKHMKRLLEEEKPDLIVCTSSIPSHVLEILLDTGYKTVPIVNVYTDFWMNNLWGTKYARYHLVPDNAFKKVLLSRPSEKSSHIYITGIPVDECFLIPKDIHRKEENPRILVSGGSMGLVGKKPIVRQIEEMGGHGYPITVLCGRNKKLYEEIQQSKADVEPVTYIDSSKAMNDLYDRCGAIVTKPGGVTMSECLHKRLPPFILGELPGQEKINKNYLVERGLVHSLDHSESLIDRLNQFFVNGEEVTLWNNRVEEYLAEVETPFWEPILEFIDQNEA